MEHSPDRRRVECEPRLTQSLVPSLNRRPVGCHCNFVGHLLYYSRSCTLGVSALGEQMCRLGGEVADLVFLDWMTPERIAWARCHIYEGAKRRAADLGRGPQVVGCVRVAFGPSAAACLGAEAAAYRSRPRYAESFAAMGSAAVGIAAIDPPQAQILAERYKLLLDETVIRPVATLPTAASPTLDEVFEALSVILEIAHAFAPAPELG